MSTSRTIPLVLVPFAVACSGPQDYLRPAGPASERLAGLGWFAIVVFSATTVVMWLLIGWLGARRRGTLAEHAPVDAEGGQRFLVVGGLVVPGIVLGIVLVVTVVATARFPVAEAHAGEPEIRVIGHQFWFDTAYVTKNPDDCAPGEQQRPDGMVSVPTELHVPVGRSVEIELVSRDVIHSFWVPKLHGKVDLVPGQVNHVRIQADRPGIFDGQCGEFCGVEHARMRIQIVAHAPADFERWLASERAPALPPATPEARAGQAAFERSACPLCHRVRGTGAQGLVGPDLTHFASRRRIAGGAFENNTANLAAWVTRAQSMKPGSQMPDLASLSGEELLAVVAYLQSLR